MTTALERFLRYVQIETTSRDGVETVPSSPGQFDLARLLAEELRGLGLSDAAVDERCYVTATLEANGAKNAPVIGFIAHLDTSPNASGKNVHPQVIPYNVGPIILSDGTSIPEDEALLSRRGKTLVVTDGSTLLGADDKAGIAAIMTAIDRLKNERLPDGSLRKHGRVRVCFTPDEEVGRGADFFDIEKFGADFAYTVDGHLPGEINGETFSAERASVTITGRDIHPGSAKGIMVNAVQILADFTARLPKERAPETTEGREPYIHLCALRGEVAHASAAIIMRAFEDDEMKENRQILETIAEEIRAENRSAQVTVTFEKEYPNMRSALEKDPTPLKKLEEAVRRAGVEPQAVAIRGGTDGSQLTERGLLCPNIFTGGHNFHSTTEWLCVEDLEVTVETLVQLAQHCAE